MREWESLADNGLPAGIGGGSLEAVGDWWVCENNNNNKENKNKVKKNGKWEEEDERKGGKEGFWCF